MRLINNYLIPVITATTLSVASSYLHGQSLSISQSPLFLQSKVDPNILLLIDDSGSMQFELLLSNDALIAHPHDQPHESDLFGNLMQNPPRFIHKARALCSGYNVLAYDPKKTYTPWSGTDIHGNPYQNITDLTRALHNPALGVTRDNVRNITRHVYYTWNDNGDGVYQDGECAGHFYYLHCYYDEHCHYVAGLSDPKQITNYGNWYSYYRNRDLVAKKAALDIASSSQARMGLATLNSNNKVGIPISSLRDNDNKSNLLQHISSITPKGGTPTNRTLYQAGLYFSGEPTIVFSSDPGLGGFDGLLPADFLDRHRRRYESPILPRNEGGECQQNFAVLMTDGYASRGFSLPGKSNYDGDTIHHSLADIAAKFYQEDLSLSHANNVPNSNGGTEKMHQHLITYGVAFGVNGNLSCTPGTDGCAEHWPSFIRYGTPDTIDDLRHATFNGRGDFFSASSPDELIDNLHSAIASIESVTATASAVSTNTASLNRGSVVYQAGFNTQSWTGYLHALPISTGGSSVAESCRDIPAGQPCTKPLWQAETLLKNRNPQQRAILTYDATQTKGVAFRAPGEASSGITQPSREIINFIRGSDNEPTFRQRRGNILGDIVHSATLFVAQPFARYPDNLEDKPYSQYAKEHIGRQAIIYVGANDGMLHAFSALRGDELFAYVPGFLHSQLHHLTMRNYATGNHRYYVDATPTVGDVYYDDQWHTVLVGGVGAGGQGVYALDVTEPGEMTEDNAENVVLWEFTDADLGYTFSRPDLVKMNNGKWAAIFGNGYNNSEYDGLSSTTGYAYLYVVDIETGETISKLPINVGSQERPNGLATVTPVDINNDHVVDYIYGGDLRGNVWRFDVTDDKPANWYLAHNRSLRASDTVLDSSLEARPIFTAKAPETGRDGHHLEQPITSRISVAYHPDSSREGLMLYFGTGRYLANGDHSDTGMTHSFYGIWDPIDSLPPEFSGSRSNPDYLRQTITKEVKVGSLPNERGLRLTSNHPINWNQHHGWYLDLHSGPPRNESRGERQVTDSVVIGDRIAFTTNLPNENPCEAGGKSFFMELSSSSGGPLQFPPFDINGDRLVDQQDFYNDNGDVLVVSGIELDGLVATPTILSPPPRYPRNSEDLEDTPESTSTSIPTTNPHETSEPSLADGCSAENCEYKLLGSSTGVIESLTETKQQDSGERTSWRELLPPREHSDASTDG